MLFDKNKHPFELKKKIGNSVFEGGKFSVLREDCFNREGLCDKLAKALDFSDIVPTVQKEEKEKHTLTYNYINFDSIKKKGAQSLAQNIKNKLNFDQFSVEKIFAWVFLTKQLDAHANNILVQKTLNDLLKPVSIDHSISIHFDDAEGEKNVVLKDYGRFATDLFEIKALEKELPSNQIIEFVNSLVDKFQSISDIFDNNRLYAYKTTTQENNQYRPNFELILKILDFQCFNFLSKEKKLCRHQVDEWISRNINENLAINYFKDIEARLNFFIRLFMLQHQLKTQKDMPFFEIMRLLFDRYPYNPQKECSTSEFLNFSHLNVEEILSNVVLPGRC